MNYVELYEKYKILEEENKKLKEELLQLKGKFLSEKTEAYCADIDLLGKKDTLCKSKTLVTQNSSSKEKIELFQSLFKV